MGIGVAFAQGVVGELLEIDREKRQANAKFLEDESALKIFKRQEEIKSGIRTEEAVTTAKATAAATADNDRLNRMLDVYKSLDKALQPQFLIDNPEFSKSMGFTMTPEFANLANTIDKSENTFVYGTTVFNKPTKNWDEDLRADNPKRAAGAWLGYFDTVFADEEKAAAFIADLKSNETYLNKFVGDLDRYSAYYIDGQVKAPNVDPSVLVDYRPPEASFQTLFSTLQNAGISTTGSEEKADTLQKTLAAETGKIDNADTAVIFKFTTPEGMSSREIYDLDKGQHDALGRIAASAGYGNNVQALVNDFTDISRAASGEEAYSVLLDAVEFEIAGYTVFNRTGGGTSQQRINLGRDLKEKYGDDPYPAVQALAAILTVDEDKTAMASRRKGRVVKMKPPEDYFSKNKLNRQQVLDQYSASENALGQLQELDSLIADKETPTGLKSKIQQVGFGIFGEGGQISQFFMDENAGGYEEGTTAESLTQVAIDGGFLSAETARNLSTIDALKLSLAAQMARAIDPSGRLSNQDFEIQLQRLGQTGLFTSKPQARASLAVVIDDFKRQRRRLQILSEVASVGAGDFGVREARLLKADRVARMASNALYVAERAGKVSQIVTLEAGQEVARKPVGKLTLDSSLGVYFDDNNQAFSDADGTKPLTPDEVLTMLGEPL